MQVDNNIAVTWDMTVCSTVDRYQCFVTFFLPKYKGDRYLKNVGTHLMNFMASDPRRL
jgi:hypothetical protein